MTDVGLREMRQNASDLVRRAEAGESITITVSGRPAALLGPAPQRVWQTFEQIADIFDTPADPTWADDRDLLDHTFRDPWAQA